jgi:hypothetical protein
VTVYFIDTNVPMYAAGRPSQYRDSCRRILEDLSEQKLEGITDAEVLQEIAYRYYFIGRFKQARQLISDFATLVSRVCPVELADVAEMLEFSRFYPKIPPRDLVHVATAKRCGADFILSVDRDFDRIKEVKRVDPRELGSGA